MAVTVHQSPGSHGPAFNPQWFVATSTQTGAPGFVYRVICTDLITSETQTYNIKQRPTSGELVFPAHVFAEKYIEHYVPNNVYGWRKCTDAIRKIRVNIGEYYSSTYYAGTNQDYIIWNGVLRPLDWPNFITTDYIYKYSTSNFVYITSDTYETLSGYYTSNRVTYSGKSHFLYVLSSQVNDMEMVSILTYDEDDVLVGEYNIANPYSSSSTYTDKYVCIDVGHKGLSEIYPVDYSVISGPAEIINDQVSYYDVVDRYTTGAPPPAEPFATNKNITRITIDCSPTFTVYTLHYLAKSGNFETLHFNMNSEHKERAEKKYYRLNPNTLSSNNYSYSEFSDWEKAMSSTGTDNFVINTNWMNEDQVSFHREIITSPLVYIDYGTVTGLVPCKVLTSEILVNKSYNNKLFGIQLEIEPTYRNNYQRG